MKKLSKNLKSNIITYGIVIIAFVVCQCMIGAGAMTVSHANDSYFWVVTNFTGMDPQDGYRTQTMMTLIVGIVSMIAIFLASLVLL